MVRPYDHQAVEWVNEDGTRECRICPTPITGIGATLRHWNEAFRPADLSPDARARVVAAAELGARALEAMWSDNVTDYDRARAIAEEMERAGMLANRRRVRVAA